MKKITLFLRLLMVLLLFVFISNCATVSMTPQTVIPEMKLASEMPVHAQNVANAVVMRLAHVSEKEVMAKTGVTGSELFVPETDFDYGGFRVRQIKFRDHITSDDLPENQYVLGYIHMQDDAGRNASVTFAANYNAKGNRVELVDGMVLPLFSEFPETEMFVVPLAALTGFDGGTTAQYDRFYQKVAAAALPMRDPGAVPAAIDEYAIVVFAKDRISPQMGFEVWPSDSELRVEGKIVGIPTEASYYCYDTGWFVGVIPASFSVASKWPFWIKAIVTDKRPSGTGEPCQIGLFSSGAMAPGGKSFGGNSKSAINHASLPKVIVAAQQ